MKSTILAFALVGFLSVAFAEEAGESEFNCDDDPSCALQFKAWESLSAGKHGVAVSFAEACIKINEEGALEQQASLSALPEDGGYTTNAALNNAGTCYFIKGESLAKLNKKAEAEAAFKMVIDKLSYAQAWDPKGWFWTVADAASESLAKLED